MMKKLMILTMCFMFFTSGCTSLMGERVIDPDYAAYTVAVQAQIQAERKPLVEFKVDDEGRLSDLAVYAQPRHIAIQQKNPHPVYKLLGIGLRYAGYVGMIWQTGEAVESIVEASSGTAMNSYNNNAGNEGTISSQADYAASKTETINTEVSSGEGSEGELE